MKVDYREITEKQMKIFDEILNERARQDEKWGEQNHDDHRWMTILVEEVGEVAKAIQDQPEIEQYEEIVQVAAVAMSWLEAMRRR